MGRTSDRGRSGFGGAMRRALPAAAAMVVASCIAVPVPIPIPLVTGLRVGPAVEDPGETRTAASGGSTTIRYDNAGMSEDQAGAYARKVCADRGESLDTLGHATPTAATSGQSSITFTCRH